MLQKSSARYFIATLYFLFISFLFFLPGSALPKTTWLDKIGFDKWVHITFFTLLLFLWNWAAKSTKRPQLFLWLLAAAVYGILVEVIQDRWVASRSFDLGDWAADIGGSILGLLLWYRYIKK